MSELNFGCLCQLLCCPPFPSAIAAKLAFMPPHPSYKLVPRNGDSGEFTLALSSFVRDSVLQYVPDNLKATKSKTRRGNEIAIVYLRINDTSKLTFLLSHGNAVDLGHALNFIYGLGSKLNVNIMCYDYSGYGASTGKPLEKNLYADAECALEVLRNKYAVPLERIVLYGQSIGTVPTVHLATIHRVAAVVLHSPLTSGLRVAFSRLKRNYCCDVFSNYVRAPNVLSPTLIIHGTEDTVINSLHAQQLYERIPNTLEPLFIRGAGHNDCELFEEFLIRLEYLVHVEVENSTEIRSSNDTDTALGDFKQSPSLSKRLRRLFRGSRRIVYTGKSNSISSHSSRHLSKLSNSTSDSFPTSAEQDTDKPNSLQPLDQSLKSTSLVWILKCGSNETGSNNSKKKRCKSMQTSTNCYNEFVNTKPSLSSLRSTIVTGDTGKLGPNLDVTALRGDCICSEEICTLNS